MFEPDAATILQVTVDGRVSGQQIINTFYYRFAADTGTGTGGSSVTFLTNFIIAYRLSIITNMYDLYSVHRYWVRGINGVAQKLGPPVTYEPVFHPDMLDWRAGTSSDQGDLTPGAGVGYLPINAVLRVLKAPENPKRRYFNRNYNRFSPFTTSDLDTDVADHDKWKPALITAWNTAFTTFATANILDQAAGNGWDFGIFSPAYWWAVQRPIPKGVWYGFQKVTAPSAEDYVGTQVTRRYSPSGAYRGS